MAVTGQAILLLAVGISLAQATTLTCTTSVKVGDGKIVIELFDDAAPLGVERVIKLAETGFLDGLPFFRAIPGFLIQFGISPDAEKQAAAERLGNIQDDPKPQNVPFVDGIVSFAGYGKDSRSTHLFLTLGSQPGLGRSPWEVPVGKVVSGLDVMHGIYTGYGDNVNQAQLNPRLKGAKDYLARFDKLDSIKTCVVEPSAKHVEL